MVKYITFLKGDVALEREKFQERYIVAAKSLTRNGEMPGRLVVNLVIDPPLDVPYKPTPDNADGPKQYDIIVEYIPSASSAWASEQVVNLASLVPGIAAAHTFRVEEIIERDSVAIVVGQRSPGVKYVGRLKFRSDLPNSAAHRAWALHAKRALKVHVGAVKYARNIVIEALDIGAPDTSGVVQLHFPTMQDLVERFFDSDRGAEAIQHDVAHFVESVDCLYVNEYVLAT
ncbi:MAG: hypothetical protein OJJ21_22025 [Ferrovibrio sp.]|uniref:EthD domain-containing protein n=1 Tax=Ferrovibrio sp. TaxID=1917215 RepID=UPI00260EA16E|nr:EthD domain-containing protein [Ferrovibrio sp.]MCW0236292.1 hypothetical protein [Ferrovibrio sp.]